MSRVFASPFNLIFLIVLVLIGVLLIPLLFLNIIGSAFTRLGFSAWEAVLIVLLTLAGSFVNIPVTTIQSASIYPPGRFFGAGAAGSSPSSTRSRSSPERRLSL